MAEWTDVIVIAGIAYIAYKLFGGSGSLLNWLKYVPANKNINQDTGQAFTDTEVLRKEPSSFTSGTTIYRSRNAEGTIVSKKTQTWLGFAKNPFLLFEKPLF